MGEGKIFYQHRTGIWVYDLASGRSDQDPIQLPSDRLQERECFVDPKATLGSWALSKDGERIAWADEKHRLGGAGGSTRGGAPAAPSARGGTKKRGKASRGPTRCFTPSRRRGTRRRSSSISSPAVTSIPTSTGTNPGSS